ncbi:hypothetical protein [Pantoea eucrina]|uniref:hypothetical protein n=1 Tax=Pantoea eucrina TaxID=472693 RepID=UPI00080F4833|nr:hypothetical protein [Pantoea eucrina]
MTVDTSSEPFKAGAILPLLYWDLTGRIWSILHETAVKKKLPQPFYPAQLADAMYPQNEDKSWS